MNTLLRLWFTILALPTILIIVVNLTDTILTTEVCLIIQKIMWFVDQILWTTNTNLLLICVSSILLIRITRRLFKFITWNLSNNDE